MPIGIYDAATLDGDIEIALGDEETGYDGLNGRYNALKNILYTQDRAGAFGSPFVDSARTTVTEATTEALQIFYLHPSLSLEKCEQLLQSAGTMFTQINGGDFTVQLLTSAQRETSF